jgi:hypothetical protein
VFLRFGSAFLDSSLKIRLKRSFSGKNFINFFHVIGIPSFE